ncbi:MAG: hypothetical protein ACFCUQ_13310 [Kiloniellales bacterium]
MDQFRNIEIDFDVHKRIEMDRRSFGEAPNAVLRRLLGIDKEGPKNGEAPVPVAEGPGGRPWSGKGVSLPHGTNVRMEYNGRVHTGRIEDGRWTVEGKAFSSPSAAAGGVATTKSGKHPSLDGWIYWQVRLPGEHDWVALAELRRRATGAVPSFSLSDF